jgi:hypothetical protein
MAKNPKAYISPHDVYTAGVYTKAGDVFVTDAPKGDDWEEKTPQEAKIIQASTEDLPSDPPLESLGVEALKAVAVTKNVNVTGMNKKQLIDAIKAANEPAL